MSACVARWIPGSAKPRPEDDEVWVWHERCTKHQSSFPRAHRSFSEGGRKRESTLPYPTLPKRWFIEAAQFARMQPWAFFAQQVHGGDADLQMLGNGAVIKGIGLARHFNLAVQGFV